jgi:acyl-CoA synthetase (AMP-forming)/AMP-acid ligase II
VLVTGRFDSNLIVGLPNVSAFDSVICVAGGKDPLPRECIDIDLAALIYTSGTNGEPKGVMLTHRNMLSAAASICQYLELEENDVVLDGLPMAFDYGLYQMLLSVRQGARLVLEPSFKLPIQVLKRAAGEMVTVFPGVPTIFALLTQLPDIGILLSSVRAVTSTGSTLSVKLIEQLRVVFPNARIFSMYGLTECKRCTYLPPEDLERKPESIGIPIPNTELWLVDEHDHRLGPNKVGQLVIRGATVMRGYWNKPEETVRTLRPGPMPGEQVLYTGDYCRLDDEGYLYFIGRMDDIIKCCGEKVSPTEVESALLAVPGVKEVAVLGVPDEVLGEAVEAVVVLEDGANLTETELRRECFSRLESFMVPKSIRFRPALPRSQNGKVYKKDLA